MNDTTPESLGARHSAAQETLSRSWTIALYAAAVFFYWASLYLYVPTLPNYVETKAEQLATVGAVLAQYGIWQAVVRLPLGVFSDWVGRRKPFIIIGLLLAGVGALVMGTANGVMGLFLGRAITGLAASAWVPLVVAFSSQFPPREAIKASALLTLVNSVGRTLATSVTGSLNQLGGYPLAFYAAAGAAGIAVLFVLPVREISHPLSQPSVRGVGKIIARRDVLMPSIIATISQYGNWAATFGFLPLLARDLGATDVMQSLLMSLHIGVVVVGQLVTTTLASRLHSQSLVYISVVALSLGLAAAAIAPSLEWVFFSQICIGISQGIGYPVLMGLSIQQVPEESRSTAMGLFQAVYAVGMSGGPALSGVLADAMGIQPMFGLTAAVCLLTGLVCTYWLTTRPRTDHVRVKEGENV